MSISIYYIARRERPLSPTEKAAVDRIREFYSIRDQVEQYVQTRKGHNGENFHQYDPNDPTESDVIFEGATKLPSNSKDALWSLVQHWCKLLSEVRREVQGAEWHVNVDDNDIRWDEVAQAYDPVMMERLSRQLSRESWRAVVVLFVSISIIAIYVASFSPIETDIPAKVVLLVGSGLMGFYLAKAWKERRRLQQWDHATSKTAGQK